MCWDRLLYVPQNLQDLSGGFPFVKPAIPADFLSRIVMEELPFVNVVKVLLRNESPPLFLSTWAMICSFEYPIFAPTSRSQSWFPES